MRFSERVREQKRPYAKISLKKREQLVKSVITDQVSISKTAKRLRIKLTTARLIVKRFRQTGTFHMKKFKEAPFIRRELAEQPQQTIGNEFDRNKFSENSVHEGQMQSLPKAEFNNLNTSGVEGPVLFYFFCPFPMYGLGF